MAFLLNAGNLIELQAKLESLGWLGLGEQVSGAEKAGEGNMNCTLRVQTQFRTFIVKQSRPWVEKYPTIPAPEERAVIEGRFYVLVAEGMPRLLGASEEDKLLAFEDAGRSARDFSFLYAGESFAPGELDDLIGWLRRLHSSFRSAQFDPNSNMRELNHEYVFVQPLTVGYAFPAEYKAQVRRLGEVYLEADGPCLLHGDYFPGSWLRTEANLRIIDPEFAFKGPPEFDAGVFLAHMYLAGVPDPEATLRATSQWCEPRLTRQFAGVEIMRRILGVAQLPLRTTAGEKEALLELSKEFVLQ